MGFFVSWGLVVENKLVFGCFQSLQTLINNLYETFYMDQRIHIFQNCIIDGKENANITNVTKQ